MKTRKLAPRTRRLGLETLEARDVPVVIGSLDPTFGTAGKATIDFGLTAEAANAVVVQTDGRIVAVGSDGNGNVAIARFRPNGLPDFTFGGGDGKYVADFGGNEVATSVAIQRDGKIVIGGYTDVFGSNDFLAMRVLADGSGLDTTFAGVGATTIAYDFGGDFDDRAYSVAIQGDGKIVLGGYDQFDFGDYDFAVIRFMPNGTLDQSFGFLGGGDFYFFDAGPGGLYEDKSQTLTIQNNGQMILAGSAQVSATGFGIAAVRINSDGSLDGDFGNYVGGQLLYTFDLAGVVDSKITGLAVQPDGKIVAAGYLQLAGTDNYDIFAVRLNRKTGTPDVTFGNVPDEYVATSIISYDLGGALDDRATGVKIQPDGKIVISGTVEVSDTESDFAITRLNPDGTYDKTFSADGKLTVDFGGDDEGNALAIGPNGRIVVAGAGGASGGFALARVIGTVEEPQSLAVAGNLDAAAITYKPDFANAQLLLSGSTVGIDSFGTNVRVASGDVNGDGFVDTILVTGPGTPIRVGVVSGDDNVTLLAGPFDPFDGDFSGGGFVAAGDFDNDGRAEFVVTPDQSGGPRVTIWSIGNDNQPFLRGSFLGINDANFRGGARAGIGDVNGDGVPDLAVTAGFQGGPRVALYNGKSVFSVKPNLLTNDFFAFEQSLRNGVYIGIGDVNGDGYGDLIFGAGPGGAARVLTISGQKLLTVGSAIALSAPISNFFMSGGSSSDRGGVRVATTDVDGDNKADVVAAPGEGTASRARLYLGSKFGGSEPKVFQDLDPYSSLVLLDGTFVG